jgi:hypothetical protein
MAIKASGAIGGASSTSPQSEKPAEKLGRRGTPPSETRQKSSALLDTRVVYCGDNLEQLGPCRTGQFWGETKEKRAFEDRRENTKAYIDYIRPRCVQLARVLKQTGSFYYHCDWHTSHYVKVMLNQIFRNCKCNCA